MSKHSRLWLLVPVAATLVALSGCTPTTPSPTSSPASGASSAPSSAPVATPTATAATASTPTPRVQLHCASLFTTPNVAVWMADTHAALKVDETTAPNDIVKIAADQLGTLTCEWGGTTQTDNAYDDALTVSIATDALDGYDANQLDEDGNVHNYTAGTKSQYACSDESGQFQCQANVLVGTTWASVFLQNNVGSSVNSTALVSHIKTILTSLAGQISSAPAAGPLWVAPTSASPAFCISSTRTTVIRAAFANPALKQSVYEGGGGSEDAQYGPASKYIGDCDWEHGTNVEQSVEVQSLQGGAWALPVVTAAAPYTDYTGSKLLPVTVAGADAAVIGCGGSNNSCDALLAVGGNLYEVTFPNKDAATNASRLGALAAHLN